MARLRYHSKPCPICGQINGKCADTEDGDGVLCNTRASALTNEVVGDYTCTKSSTDTGLGISSVWYRTELAHCKDPFERLSRIYKRARLTPDAEPPTKAEPIAPSAAAQDVFVPVDERDIRHRELLAVFKEENRFQVSAAHVMAMDGRLYSAWPERSIHSRMGERGYFSVTTKNQRVQLPYPIPGARANPAGWELRLRTGLYAPMRDAFGHLLGWEVRSDSDQGGRYSVLSCTANGESTDCCPIGIPDYGEQPISWCLPAGWSTDPPPGGYNQIILCEGKGIKPQVVADRFGQAVLGCGGSLHGGGSPTQLLQACKQLAPGGRLILFADAGWLVNPNVATQMAHTVGVLEREGFLPLIACARAWMGESKTALTGSPDKAKPERRFDFREAEEYIGSDPDELPGDVFHDCCRQARSLAEWSQDNQTSEEVRTAIQNGLRKVEAASDLEEHIRRNSGANRRARHSIKPLLLRSELPVTKFAADKQCEATLQAIKRCQKAEAKRFAAYAEPLMPQCRKAERDAIRRYWHTHRAWEKWLWNPNHHRLRLSQEKEGELIVTPPERLQRLLKEAVKTFARAVAWQKLLRCKPAEEHFEVWAHDIDEDQKKAFQRSESGEGSFPVAEWCEGRFLPELQNEHPYTAKPRVVFNTSGTGAGKTYTIAQPEAVRTLREAVGGSNQGVVLYLNNNYRTPAVPQLQSWGEVPARHGGLVRTEDGRLVRATEATSAGDLAEPANCAYSHRLNQIVERGHSSAVSSKWCSKLCPLRPEKYNDAGRNVGGDGSCRWVKDTWRPFVREVVRPDSDRAPALQQLRTGTDSLMGLLGYGPAFLSKALVVIDESDQLKAAVSQTIRLTHDDLMQLMKQLHLLGFKEQEEQAQARGLLEALDRLLDPPSHQGRDHGMGVMEVRTDARVQRALQVIAQAHRCDTDGSIRLRGGWNELSGVLKFTEQSLLISLGSATTEEQAKRSIEGVPMTVLPDLIAAVMPQLVEATGQSLVVAVERDGRQSRRVLHLVRRRPELTQALASAGAVLVLDATERPEDSLELMKFPEGAHSEVIAVRQGDENTGARLALRQVPCLGGMGRQRSEKKTAERNELIDVWLAKAPGAEWGVIDHGRFCRGDGERAWLTVMARGGNFLETASRLALVGLPIKNLNAIDQETELVFGSGTADPSSEAYRRWQAHLVAIELVQGVGRLRANRRSAEEELEVLLVTDANLAGLCQQMGWEIPTPIRSVEITGQAPKISATENAMEQVKRYLGQRHVAGDSVPGSQQEACTETGVSLTTFRKALIAEGLDYYGFKSRVLREVA